MDQRKCGALVTIHLPASVIIDNYLNDVANKSIYLSIYLALEMIRCGLGVVKKSKKAQVIVSVGKVQFYLLG